MAQTLEVEFRKTREEVSNDRQNDRGRARLRDPSGKRFKRTLFGIGLVLILAVGGLYFFAQTASYESTDDAFVDGHITNVAPKIATLALSDVDAALTEVGRAFDQLKVDGVVLMSNYEGVYLGHPSFEPVWKELNRRCAVVYIHPSKPQIPLLPGIPGPITDYPFDSTRTAVDLVTAGHMTRLRSIRVILSQAGGFLPYAAARFAKLMHAVNPNRTVEALTSDMQAFYFDTALSTPTGLPSLLAFAPPGHILFGSDYPYAPAGISASFTAELDAYSGLTADQHKQISHSNAATLFPRLAFPQPDTAPRSAR
jgi:predicted TIM-barrel fold metal-dependent hydrolase